MVATETVREVKARCFGQTSGYFMDSAGKGVVGKGVFYIDNNGKGAGQLVKTKDPGFT